MSGQFSGHEAQCPCPSVGDRGCPFTSVFETASGRCKDKNKLRRSKIVI